MVDLGGYVIILVETRDKKIKLYGMCCKNEIPLEYHHLVPAAVLLLLAALACVYGQVLIGSAPVVWEGGRVYMCVCVCCRKVPTCISLSLSLFLSVPQHLLRTIVVVVVVVATVAAAAPAAAAGAKRIIITNLKF